MNFPPPQYVLEAFRTDIGPPMFASAGVFLLLRYLFVGLRNRISAFAFVVGLVVGNLITGHLQWQVISSDWKPIAYGGWPFIIVAAMVAAIGSELVRFQNAWAHGIGRFLQGMAIILVTPMELWMTQPWIPVLFMATIATLIAICERCDAGGTGAFPALLVAVNAGFVAVLILLAHSGRFSELALIIAASLAGVAITAMLTRTETRPAMVSAIIAMMGLLLAGQQDTFSDVPAGAFILTGIAPLGLLAERCVPKWRKLSMGVAVLVPLVAALAWAIAFESLSF